EGHGFLQRRALYRRPPQHPARRPHTDPAGRRQTADRAREDQLRRHQSVEEPSRASGDADKLARRMRLRLAAMLLATAALVGTPAAAHPRPPRTRLLVGVGRADVTPATGVYKGGWACTCAQAL